MNHLLRASLFVIGASMVITACGKEGNPPAPTSEVDAATPPPSPPSPPSRPDAAVADAGPDVVTDAASDGGTCSSLAQLSLPLTAVSTREAPPVLAGGAITPGTYRTTSVAVHSTKLPEGASMEADGATLRLGEDGTFDLVEASAADQERTSGRYEVSGTTILFHRDCRFPVPSGATNPTFSRSFETHPGSIAIGFDDGFGGNGAAVIFTYETAN